MTTNTRTAQTYGELVEIVARTAIEQGAGEDYIPGHGDYEALEAFAGTAPDATTRDQFARDVQAEIAAE